MIQRRYLVAAAAGGLLAVGVVRGATASFEYDALGRLTQVMYDDGKFAIYKYDAAGNRTQVLSGTVPGAPASISVPSSSTTGAYTISWGASTGSPTAYALYESTSSTFSSQTLVYTGTALSVAVSGRSNGTYYYRVRGCIDSACGAYRTGSNGVTVTLPAQIQVLNPSIQVGATGQLTQITTLANLNGNPATIQSFTETCGTAGAAIQTGAQKVKWTNSNNYYYQCETGTTEQCSASYVIRNSNTGQTYPGTATITVLPQSQSLPPGQSCPVPNFAGG